MLSIIIYCLPRVLNSKVLVLDCDLIINAVIGCLGNFGYDGKYSTTLLTIFFPILCLYFMKSDLSLQVFY